MASTAALCSTIQPTPSTTDCGLLRERDVYEHGCVARRGKCARKSGRAEAAESEKAQGERPQQP